MKLSQDQLLWAINDLEWKAKMLSNDLKIITAMLNNLHTVVMEGDNLD